MPSFSDKSLAKLATCDPLLQRVFREAIQNFDCTILEGHRDQARQNQGGGGQEPGPLAGRKAQHGAVMCG